jgi:mRNA interferase MazF
MERFIEGEIVVVPFPNSDLSGHKRRPALIIKSLVGNDVMLCQITSKKRYDCYSVGLDVDDFEDGSLHEASVIRPNRLFTADVKLILYKIGKLYWQTQIFIQYVVSAVYTKDRNIMRKNFCLLV